MRERDLRVLLLIYLAPLVYLSEANILATAGGVKLPFSIGTENIESFGVQMVLLILQIVGILTVAMVIRRQRRKNLKVSPVTTPE